MRATEWTDAVDALRAVHEYGTSQDLGALEHAMRDLAERGADGAAAVVAEWYAVRAGENTDGNA